MTVTADMAVPSTMRLFGAASAGRRSLEVVRVVESPVATHLKYRFVK
ncbi:hypothetical protein ACIF80_15775 [Streptomyces sp. NPDC085927]